MWTKEAIKKIGKYNTSIPGVEDFEYLLRTFKINEKECKINKNIVMKYIRDKNTNMYLYEKNIKN